MATRKRCTKTRARKGLCVRKAAKRGHKRVCRKANGQIKRCARKGR